MANIKVSIIIPFYNVEKYIEQCIKSVINQTLQDIEILCIDDGSTDKTAEVLSHYLEQDSRIKLIKLENHSGQGVARNIAIEQAQGEYIGFVDSDDWADETMFEKLYNNAISQNTDISMCGTKLYDNTTSEYKDDGYYQLETLREYSDKVFNAKDIQDKILNINVTLWNKIYRKQFLTEIGEKLPEGYIYEDMPFFFATFLKAQTVSLINENLYYYRINRADSTMTKCGEKVLDRIDMLKLTYQKIKESEIFENVESSLINWLIDDTFLRAVLIDAQYFEKYFSKMLELFSYIGFGKDETLTKKNITFYKAVILLQNMTVDSAKYFIYNFFVIDKKLDKLYIEISNCYSYINFKNSIFENKISDIDNINAKISEILKNSEIQNEFVKEEFEKVYNNNTEHFSEIQTTIENQNKIVKEEFTKVYNNNTEHFSEIQTTIENQNKIVKEEFTKVYNNNTEHFSEMWDNCSKLIYVSKQELNDKFDIQLQNQKNDLQYSVKSLEQNSKTELEKAICNLKYEFQQEKEALAKEFERKLNIEHAKYERKLIALEEKYDAEIKQMSPIIKFINKIGRKNGKK